jgi:uncharacterized protein DUF955
VKSLSNPYLRRICSLVGEKNPRLAVEGFVQTRCSPDETLNAIAFKLGVGRIIEENLPFEGGLFHLPDGELVIKLNARSSFVRKRFTIAHEIGHLLLETVPAFRNSHHADSALERTCDMIAAELLMPSEEAVPFITELGQPSPEKLKIIASKYAVSHHVAAIRVHADLRLWRCFIGCWDRHPVIKTAWFVGDRRWDRTEPDSYSLDLALSSDTSVQLKEWWQKGAAADPVWLNLQRIGNNGRVLGLLGFVS